MREARAVAALNHPNICTLYDVGPNYLVMEYIEGDSPRGPLAVETVLGYARQIAAALDAAHEKAIVHRDLKPANLRVTPDGVLKVLDFGLARLGPGEPDLSRVPGRLLPVVRWCLEKEPKKRLRDIADVLPILDQPEQKVSPAAPGPSGTGRLWKVVAAAAVLSSVGLGAMYWSRKPAT